MSTTPFTPGWPPEWPQTPMPLPTAPPSPTTPLPEWPPPGPGNDWLLQRLFENRIVLVHGVIDREAATRLTSQLLALDAATQRPIQLHIDSPSADLTAALLLADTLDLLRVSTHALVIGEAGGGALALLVGASQRRAYRHARIRLSEPQSGIRSIAPDAEHHLARLAEFVDRLANATHKAPEEIRADLRSGRFLTAAEAVDYGLIDELAT